MIIETRSQRARWTFILDTELHHEEQRCGRISIVSVGACHEYSSSFRNQWHRRMKYPTSERRNGASAAGFRSGYERLEGAMEMHDKRACGKTAYEHTCGGLLISFGARVSYNPPFSISSKVKARLHQFGKKNASQTFHGLCIAFGAKGRVEICSLRTAKTATTCQPLQFHVERLKHQEVTQKESRCIHVQAVPSNSSSFPNTHRCEMPGSGILERDEKEEVLLCEDADGNFVRSMSGECTFRHREIHRTKLYVPDETTFLIPPQFVDVTRQAAILFEEDNGQFFSP